jgi:hypothetical protein
MSVSQLSGQAVHTRLWAISVTDGLARALRVAGEFPPPAGAVACQIPEQLAPLARTFEPPLVLWSFRNHSGFLIVDGTVAHEGDRERRIPLGAGTYRVRVRAAYYQDQEFTLAWPPPEGQTRIPVGPQDAALNIELRPGAAYPLPDVTAGRFQLGPTILRGSLFTPAGEPLPGVLVEIVNLPPFLQPQELPPLTLAEWPFVRATTSARGDWVLVLPGRRYLDNAPEIPGGFNPPPITKRFTLRVHYSAGPVDLPQTVALGTEHSVRNTALRGQVVGPGGRPMAGAQIATSAGPATSVSRGDGVWFLYFALDQLTVNNVTVTVTTPDGATASDSSATLRAGATVVVPTFHLP